MEAAWSELWTFCMICPYVVTVHEIQPPGRRFSLTFEINHMGYSFFVKKSKI